MIIRGISRQLSMVVLVPNFATKHLAIKFKLQS
jgi:hypothetical protein